MDRLAIWPIRLQTHGGDQIFRTSTLTGDHPEGEEHKDDLRGESAEGNYIYRHHVDKRGKLYVPKEGSLPIPMQQIDVVMRTFTTTKAEETLIRTLLATGTFLNLGLV